MTPEEARKEEREACARIIRGMASTQEQKAKECKLLGHHGEAWNWTTRRDLLRAAEARILARGRTEVVSER